MYMGYKPLGDQALQITFSNQIDRQTIMQIRAFQEALQLHNYPFVIDSVPCYTTLTIFYDPLQIDYPGMVEICLGIERVYNSYTDNIIPKQTIEVPVLYGGDFGPDLEDVAAQCRMTRGQVIERHTRPEYYIYMIGFTPGFPYLGGLDPELACPRLDKPRLQVRAGSVGIAGNQTGIYSVDSPGGWRIIGHTPIKVYDPKRENPFLLQAGDSLKFVSISEDEYRKISSG